MAVFCLQWTLSEIMVPSDHNLIFTVFGIMLWGLTRRAVTLLHVLNTWFIAKLVKKKNEIKRFKHLRWYWYVWVLFYSVHIMQENSLLSGERNCTAGKIHTCWSRQVSPLLGVSFLIACFSFFFAFFGQDFSLVSFDNRNTADMNLISVL